MTKENELTPFLFKDTGKLVYIRKVSPMLAMQLRRDFPPPQPPLVQVSIGEDDKPVLESNPADPDFARQLKEYDLDFNQKSQSLMIKRGVSVTMTAEIKAEIDELREFYRKEYGKEISVDDHTLYVTMICVGTGDDLQELIQAIMSRSQPTEEAVALATATFPGKV